MVTFNPLSANIQLVACDLETSTSSNLSREKGKATENTRRAEQALLEATPLHESHIPCLDDTTRLHFLDDVPFYLVQASCLDNQRSYKPRAPSRSASNTPITSPKSPKALGIILTLPKSTFVDMFDKPSLKIKGQPRFKQACIKWDIFFNGEHTVSDFQSSRYARGKHGIEQTFENGNLRVAAGVRVNMLFERPWVIETHATTAVGTKADATRAGQRWRDLSQAILQRADEYGYDKNEKRSPVGAYLASLADMQMPEAMATMQADGGMNFGVVDVVITAGEGRKGVQISDSHYLFGPERLLDSRYKQMPAGWQPSNVHEPATGKQDGNARKDSTVVEPNFHGFASTAASVRTKRNIAIPLSYKDKATRKMNNDTTAPLPDIVAPTPSERTSFLPPFPAVAHIDFNDAIAITPTKLEEIRRDRGAREESPSVEAASRLSPTKHMLPPPTIPRSASKRRHSDTIHIDTSGSSSPSKLTPGDSTRPGSVAGSKSVSGYMGMTKRGIFSSGAKAVPAQMCSPSPAMTSARTLPLVSRIIISDGLSPVVDRTLTSPYKLRDNDLKLTSPHQPLDESVLFTSGRRTTRSSATAEKTKTQPVTPGPSNSAPSPFTNAPSMPPPSRLDSVSPSKASPTPKPTAPRTQLLPSTPVLHDKILADEKAKWREPELSRDCVIRYTHDDDVNMLRHVKSGRAGVFIESEVLFAVRFVVSGA